ncbi:hypothetical protein JOD45_002292 [Scopulibacillus daqui]|uniref:Uncharacterized protein n=1 Tax=Scopulibacillus daqui TaxID=1469162 RepID=A0ABS2Q1A0_9BACL|nr:hypothetical protein [Scopulibacillus daqui]
MNSGLRSCPCYSADNYGYGYPAYTNKMYGDIDSVVYAPYQSCDWCKTCYMPPQACYQPSYECKAVPPCSPAVPPSPCQTYCPPQPYCCPPRPRGGAFALGVVLFIILVIGGGYFLYRSGYWFAGGRC